MYCVMNSHYSVKATCKCAFLVGIYKVDCLYNISGAPTTTASTFMKFGEVLFKQLAYKRVFGFSPPLLDFITLL